MGSTRLLRALGPLLLFLWTVGAATAQSPAKPSPSPTPQKAATEPAPKPSAAPERVETITYDNWTVTCRDTVDGSTKRSCSALFRVIDQNRQLLLAWILGFDKEGKLTSFIRVPTGITAKDNATGATSTGILVKNGVELKLGNAAARHLGFVACEPQWCEASTSMDPTFRNDAISAPDAVVTIYTTDGSAVSYPALPLKGIDKAIGLIGH